MGENPACVLLVEMANEPSSPLIINIKDLLEKHRVENLEVEFKASWNKGGTSWQILHSITAFANDYLRNNSGYIIIGVKDVQVQVCGVPHEILDKMQKTIRELCKENICPPYYPILSPEIYNGKHVLVIWATKSDNGPHKCKASNQGEFQFYIRRGSETIQASQSEARQLLLQHDKIPFDDRMARHSGKESILFYSI